MVLEQDKVLSKIHTIELSLYREFARICNKYDLRYYAIQGTTLGVIFWGGFIPWDDDMDLGMPIEDYEKFVKIVNRNLPKNMSFIESLWGGGKIINNDTTFFEVTQLPDPSKWHGVFIDIVPLVAVPDDSEEYASFCGKMREYHLEAYKFEYYPEETNTNKADLLKKRKKLLHYAEYGKTEYITDFSFGYYYRFRTEGFMKPLERTFSGQKIFISSTYDHDLKSRYGVYKKYPNKNMTYSHRKYAIVDLNKSFLDLANEYRNLPNWIRKSINKERNLTGEYYAGFNWFKEQNERLLNEVSSLNRQLDEYNQGLPKYITGRIKAKINYILHPHDKRE